MGKKKVFRTLCRPLSVYMAFLLAFSLIPSFTPVHAAGDGAAEPTLDADAGDAAFEDEISPGAADGGADPVSAGDPASVQGGVAALPQETSADIPDGEPGLEVPEPIVYSCKSDDGISVNAVVSPECGIPKDAKLLVNEVNTGDDIYQQAYDTVRDTLGLSASDTLYFVPYDIHFETTDSTKVEPVSGSVQVKMQFASDPFASADVETPSDAEKFVAHVKDDGSAERIGADFAEGNTVTFAVSSFSVMGPAMVVHNAGEFALDGDYTEIYVPKVPEGVGDAVSAKTVEDAVQHLTDQAIIWLTDDVAMDAAALSGRNIVIRSYGDTAHVLTKNGSKGNMFVLSDGAALTLENVVVDATDNTQGRTIVVSGNSTLTLGAGSVLENNTSHGAVYLDGSAINVNGGTVRGNTAADVASTKTWAPALPNWKADTLRYYYDVSLGADQGLGGAVLMVNGSEFTISSGSVSGNSAICGGAVYAWGGSTITLSGGSVSDNTATGVDYTAAGGAIAVDNGACTFTINGAEIARNNAKHGGAFWFGIDTGKLDFSMTSGDIRENTATDGSVAYFLGYDSLIDISGNGSIIENNTASGNGAIYVGMYPGHTLTERAFLTVRDGATFSRNHAAKGSCMYLTRDKGVNGLLFDGAVFTDNETTSDGGVLRYGVPNSTFTVRNSTFTGNRTNTNGGCFYVATDAQYSTFVFDGSVFKNNYAEKQGGVWRGFPPYSDITYTNCTFDSNTAKLGDGGCFYFPGDGPESDITIDGGSFTNNKSGSSGGAFRANLNGGVVIIKGGALFQGNSADVNAGAFSIRRKGAGYYGEAYLLECDVLDNVCNADFSRYTESDKVPTEHYNTGGIYIGENITCHMYDALVTDNYVESGFSGNVVGSGIGLCPNAEVFLYPDHGAMIYGNGDENTMDIIAVPYDECINHETPAMLYVSDVTPDGRPYNWTDLDNEEARTGMYDWTNIRSGVATVAAVDDGNYHGETTLTPVGFKANVADAGIMTMAANGEGTDYSVRIIGNYTKSALYAAGGMMVNGTVISGEFNVTVKKEVEVKGAANPEAKKIDIINSGKEYKFKFSIQNKNSSGPSINGGVIPYEVRKDGSLVRWGSTTFTRGTTTVNNDTISSEFNLKADETISFKFDKSPLNIQNGVDYKLTLEEIDKGGASSYWVEWKALDESGTELNGSFNTDNQYSGSAIKTFQFTVTNTFEFGELHLTKTVAPSPPGEKDKLFKFHIALRTDPGSTPLSGTFPVELYDKDGMLVSDTVVQGSITFNNGAAQVIFGDDGMADVSLKDGQTLKIKDLPSDASYTVTEEEDENYTSSTSNNTGVIPKPDTDGNAKAAEVTCTNTRKTGDLTVSKTVAGNAGDTEKDWIFNIVLKNSDGTVPAGEYDYEIKDPDFSDSVEGKVTVDASGDVTIKEPVGSEGSIKLKHNQSIIITGLPAGATYAVTEAEANKDGYRTEANGEAYDDTRGVTGTIVANDPAATQANVVFKNIKNTAILPETGGPGSAGMAMLSALLCLAGCLIILSATGRRGKHSRRARFNHQY